MTNRAHRLVAAGSLAVAALAAPLVISLSGVGGHALAGPPCLASGSFNGQPMPCLGYSDGNGINLGSPGVGVYGPNSGSGRGGGIGVTTGPLFPGNTWTSPLG